MNTASQIDSKGARHTIDTRLAVRNVAFAVIMSLLYIAARHYKPLNSHEKEIIAKIKGEKY